MAGFLVKVGTPRSISKTSTARCRKASPGFSSSIHAARIFFSEPVSGKEMWKKTQRRRKGLG
ncbi:MAG: hypothetical protein KDD47_28980, partial [Acidobacteria bacterium]|nr:hypothetical protein [Acidobacteriota bacterium]